MAAAEHADNEALVRRYFQAPAADFYTEDAELHDTTQPAPLRGRPAIAAFLRIFLQEGFPTGGYRLHRVVADARTAFAEWTFQGTNTGPLMGAPATGRTLAFSGVSVYEIEDGRFVRARVYYDSGTVADQLGFSGGRLPLEERSRWSEWWQGAVG